ncbi:chemotaxis protein CheW [Clostridium sp. Marseille-P299]|uniref:chemotaxis protein CheW n=1 Tax=Clostridium sp. Marseille-P299 TaxID=1805477 RepID=UPI0008377873|nr:chemotaxis protein CheW [Clostridium sp. Marseille-P299]
MEATKQVIFKLGDEEYGFDIMLVNAIETYTGVVPVPNAPEYILGILNLRGDVIPVYSLRVKFGLPKQGSNGSQLIVTRSKGMLIGFQVDFVHEIVEIGEKQLSEVPVIVKSEKTAYSKAVANIGGRMVILLDHDGILNAAEHNSITALVEKQLV